MKSVLFWLGFATFSAHAMDSMTHADWQRVLPGLTDDVAMPVYVIAHIPLLALIVWLTSHDASRVRAWSRIVFAAFLVAHVCQHMALDPPSVFDTQLSSALIYGASLLGLGYLIAVSISHLAQNNLTKQAV